MRGCYAESALKELPGELRAGVFDDGCIHDDVKRRVTFVLHDVREAAPAGRFDLVLCPNLAFTYFAEPLQVEVGRRLAGALAAGGARGGRARGVARRARRARALAAVRLPARHRRGAARLTSAAAGGIRTGIEGSGPGCACKFTIPGRRDHRAAGTCTQRQVAHGLAGGRGGRPRRLMRSGARDCGRARDHARR